MTEDMTERPGLTAPAKRTMVGPRVRLRPPSIDDAPTIAKLLGDYDIARMLSRVPWPYTLADAEYFIREHGDETVFAICLKKSDTLVGLCGLQTCDGPGKKGELGFWIGRPYWGNGYATEAAHAAIDYGFTALGLDEIEVSCRVINEASRRVIWKCGFHFRGNGMTDTVAAGRVASEHFSLDKSCWKSLKAWGGV
ncbi:GNAT family N-acetyltransferase [Jiella marina]|uniref:GNAT family N-acetyltransferase n=1 Tax=Jiella sp. LLJ827 TaxID=2917712 RepID=UPI002100ADAF|nr:GNAT family N-acetyltransferase [Jiella sp. LLJ827]MCQ0987780.1 GNAT family N-acetyltransferase [Jiella sp. LLJ827]